VKEFWLLGGALAGAITNLEDVITVCECSNDDKKLIGFTHNFIYRKSINENFDWIKSLYKELEEKKFSAKALSNILIPLNQNQQLWNFVASLDEEIQNEYWQNINPHFYHINDEEKAVGIELLLKYKRFFSAITIASQFANVISSNLLSEMLKKAATEEANETPRFTGYEIERIFIELDMRADIDKSILIQLEWRYLLLLGSYSKRKNPKTLEEELANNPDFFIEVLKWSYNPTNKRYLVKESGGILDEAIPNRAKQAYHLLDSWKKIPGMKKDNSIDEGVLREWIIKARTLAESVSRLSVADFKIGKVLAEYPEKIQEWPQV
jgi:hypothetical protein